MKLISLLMALVLLSYCSSAQISRDELNKKIETLVEKTEDIPLDRQVILDEIAQSIYDQLQTLTASRIIFICTHNSRRSQLSELWMRVAVAFFELGEVATFSGGTESTAFNPRMVDALKRYGFTMRLATESQDNPHYISPIQNPGQESTHMFSKRYNDLYNPQRRFIAVMVCSDADKGCPIVQGADVRHSLPYIDPKLSDDSPQESATYDAKVEEIGIEMLYIGKKVQQLLY